MEIKIDTRKLVKKGKIILNLIFADAKQSYLRIMSVFSALFWTWLEFSFLKFFFMYIIGIAGYVTSGDFSFTWNLLLDNVDFVNLFAKVYFIIIFLYRIPIYRGRNLK